jgi:hypothetical protein
MPGRYPENRHAVSLDPPVPMSRSGDTDKKIFLDRIFRRKNTGSHD